MSEVVQKLPWKLCQSITAAYNVASKSKGNKSNKHPRSKHTPSSSPTARSDKDLSAWKSDPVRLVLSTFDADGPWGFEALRGQDWQEILRTIENWQTMTWSELLSATGGVRSGTNNHEIDASSISNRARQRLDELQREDIDTLMSLRVRGRVRIYGIRKESTCSLIWFDPWHDDARRAVCPSSKRHT